MKYTFMENFKDKDPEFYDFYSHFIGEEVINDTTLDDKSRYLSITAVLLGTKSHDLFKDMLDDLLKYLTREFDSCLQFFTNQIAQNVDYINAFEFFYCQISENKCTNMG